MTPVEAFQIVERTAAVLGVVVVFFLAVIGFCGCLRVWRDR